MSISLTDLITDVEAKIASADSSTSTAELLKIIKSAQAANIISHTYDSSGVMTVDSASVGNLLFSNINNFLYVLDSAGGSWSPITGSEGGGGGSDPAFNGSQYGYAGGGDPYSSFGAKIQKFSFTSDGNATDVGNLNTARESTAGSASSTHGYISGGGNSIGAANTDREKWSFASDANLTQVSSSTWPVSMPLGNSSPTYGYGISGYGPTIPTIGFRGSYKFPFASDADTLVSGPGNLAFSHTHGTSVASLTHGYIAAGYHNPPPYTSTNAIEKYSFANDNDAASHGTVLSYSERGRGTNSSTHGYMHGQNNPGNINRIEKFPFATDGGSTDVADLTEARHGADGSSSTTHGYAAGGMASPGRVNTIDKYNFAADDNATNVGDLTTAGRDGLLGQVHY